MGGTVTKKVDVRVVAATNRDLEDEVQKGLFREDLFYRLNVIPIQLPPLRDRGDDVLMLAEYFMEGFCAGRREGRLEFSEEATDMLLRYHWPGNVRELENIMERMSILCDTARVTPEDLPAKIMEQPGQEESAPRAHGGRRVRLAGDEGPEGPRHGPQGLPRRREERLLREALQAAGGVKNQAAELLGIKRTTLIEKLKKKGIQ